MLRFHQVGRRYGVGGRWVLRGVSLALPAGTLTRVTGANGTGKSTLLRLVAGIDSPSEGRIEGRPRTAYVPERFPPALPFTAYGYLTHLGRIHGLHRRTARDRAAHWLDRFGAEAYADTELSELSKGTSQKVAVAQALLAEPELLVLDEAWTGLDAAAREELDAAVGERIGAGASVLFVDHDPRRLAGEVTTAYEVTGSSLVPAAATSPPEEGEEGEGGEEGQDGSDGDDGDDGDDRVRIDAQAPPGTEPPAGLPPGTLHERDPSDPSGTVRFSVPSAHSDALLRTLLTAPRPWHIRRVHRPSTPARTR